MWSFWFGQGSGREFVSGNVEKITVKEYIRCEREKKHEEERERERERKSVTPG